jgi:hypothetical protein
VGKKTVPAAKTTVFPVGQNARLLQVEQAGQLDPNHVSAWLRPYMAPRGKASSDRLDGNCATSTIALSEPGEVWIERAVFQKAAQCHFGHNGTVHVLLNFPDRDFLVNRARHANAGAKPRATPTLKSCSRN